MTTEVFAQWFNKFVALVTERPLLLIFHGHLTHVSVNVIEKAIEENITIVKLPPHVTRRQVTTAGCGMFWSAQERVGKNVERLDQRVGPKAKNEEINFRQQVR